MRNELLWLDDALATSNIVNDWTNFSFESDVIKATDGRIAASIPCETGMNCMVPGKELLRVLNACDKEIKVSEDDTTLKVTAGRFRATLPKIAGDLPVNIPLDLDWKPVPADLVNCIRAVRPFVSEDATHLWAMGVILHGGYCIATNNTAFAATECENLSVDELILPAWAADFVLERDGLTHWAWDETFVAFKWESGAVMRSVLIDSRFPEKVLDILEAAKDDSSSEDITDDFKETFTRVSKLSDGVIDIYPDKVAGVGGAASVEEETTGFQVPEGFDKSTWSAKVLEIVLKVAQSWRPCDYPAPCPFKGERVFGVILGRK